MKQLTDEGLNSLLKNCSYLHHLWFAPWFRHGHPPRLQNPLPPDPGHRTGIMDGCHVDLPEGAVRKLTAAYGPL